MSDAYDKGFNNGYRKGWNDCIDFIKKHKNKKDKKIKDIWKEIYEKE
jgi:hypothetical protein